MYVLALDTSSHLGSVALTLDGELLAEISLRSGARHGETLLPLVEQTLRGASIEARELGLLAVGLGPGSFTGTRVGVATVQGLHLATGAPVVGVSSLQVIASAIARSATIAVAVSDAQRGEVFVAAFGGDDGYEEIAPPFAAAPAEAFRRLAELEKQGPLRIAGDGARRYREELEQALPWLRGPTAEGSAAGDGAGALGDRCATLLSPLYDRPRAALLAELGGRIVAERGASDPHALEPRYVRPSDAELPPTSAREHGV